jgi:hypothetical protein
MGLSWPWQQKLRFGRVEEVVVAHIWSKADAPLAFKQILGLCLRDNGKELEQKIKPLERLVESYKRVTSSQQLCKG